MIYKWSRHGRRLATLLAVAGAWSLAVLLWLWLDAAWFVVALTVIASLPACLDLIRNPQARLEVWPHRLVWASSFGRGDRNDVDLIRLDRRFDGGVRITVMFANGTHTRLPPHIAPPLARLEQALMAANIPVQRHPFSPF